jgi:hypothetical protein
MSRTDYRTLLDRGRKAGLRTSELYRALSTRPAEGGDYPAGQADGNGFIARYGEDGHRTYGPLSGDSAG